MKSLETLNQIIEVLVIVIESGVALRVMWLAVKGIMADDISEQLAGIKNSIVFGVLAVLAWAIAGTVVLYFRWGKPYVK